jgi:hypothetical protein
MAVPKQWIQGGWYPRGLIVGQHRYRPSDSNKDVDINRVSFIRYAQNRKIGKPNNLKLLGAIKPKCLNRLPKSAKVTYVWGERTLVWLIITL